MNQTTENSKPTQPDWVKPTFERESLKDALGLASGTPSGDLLGYS